MALSSNLRSLKAIMRTCFCLLLFSLFLLLQSCGQKEKNLEQSYDVDRDLLGITYTDEEHSYEMGIPSGWVDITEYIRSAVGETLEETNLFLTFQKSWGNLDDTVFMISFDFDYQLVDNDKEIAITTVLENLGQRGEVIAEKTFEHNGINFSQLTTKNEDIVNIVVFGVVNEESVVMLDYYIPKEHYNRYLEQIGSSIGSIKGI